LETLERRELMAFTPLGSSLPDLTISAFTSPVASWGQPMTATLDVHNIGASTLIEPLALQPGATSTADAPPSEAGVFITNRPFFNINFARQIGSVDLPEVPQNSEVQIATTFNLPDQPPGFPGDGGRIFIWFVANVTKSIPEMDLNNNLSNSSRVRIQAPFPELIAVGLDTPPVMQPGDTIQPNIAIANVGPADTAPQGPVTVALVASLTPRFGPGSSIIAEYQIPNIPGISQTSSRTEINSGDNLFPQSNIVGINGVPVTLPTTPSRYFIGVVIDPNHQIKQIQGIGRFHTRSNSFALSRPVGPPIRFLPPAHAGTSGVVVPNAPFPFPATNIPVGTNPNTSTNFTSGGFPVFAQAAPPIGHGIHFASVQGIKPRGLQ
jgi:hypothetical protein